MGVGTIYNFDMFYNSILDFEKSRKGISDIILQNFFSIISKIARHNYLSFPIVVIRFDHFVNEVFCFVKIIKSD
jgi:hypothetical protein